MKTGYSKNIFAHGKCEIISTRGKYLIQTITEATRLDGTKYLTYSGSVTLVNKDEVSNIKEKSNG